MRKIIMAVIGIVALIGLLYFGIDQYEFVFSKTVSGKILKVARVTQPTAIIGNAEASQMYSFAIAIQGDDGKIYTASTEDRQWEATSEAYCARARFYPYPPWDLDKSGTYHNARLLEMYDCNRKPPAGEQ